ncbi:hypothetical protein CK203_026178 [Vitis vinifera]|uniref:Uncharacterized protein n=1 Tax=Vitis vinifera TaxID=29760 RepID=A0A438IJ63_VITVI|nr:hypothetical protein CK203_026178 [Vitis vinifera]
MVETSRDWSEKLPFALWAYRTSFRTSTGATPYSLVYGMEAMLPVEIEMGSLRVALEQQIPEADWAQARFDQLNLLDERRLRAADHVRAYQRKMARAFKKRVKPRPLHGVDPRGRCMVDGFRWKPILRANQCGSAKEVLCLRPWSQDGWPSFRDPSRFDTSHHHYTYHYSSFCFICLLIDIIFTLGILRSMAHETTLRPWDQMSSSAASTWTGLIQLCSDYQDRSWILTDLRDHHLLDAHRDVDMIVTLRSSEIHPAGPHFSTLGFHHASPSGSLEAIVPHISVTVSITRSRYIVFASLTVIPELFIDMSSRRSIVRDS